MDALVLIDRLDEIVESAKSVPFSDQIRFDRNEINGLLDQLRATIPEEVKQARLRVKERQETLAETRREADRLIADARERASAATAQTEVARLAEQEADQMIAAARRQANSLLSEVEDWADETLAVLEANLDNFLAASRRGRQRLQQRSQETVVASIHPDGASDPEQTAKP